MRLVQLSKAADRAIAEVQEPRLRILRDFASICDLAAEAIRSAEPLTALVARKRSDLVLDYDAIYQGREAWRLLPPFDHPQEPARCIVSGTGLTHLGSASDRDAMHGRSEQHLTDSMKMFRWGVEGGRPAPNAAGIAPEWFHKGNGSAIRAHGESLVVPAYAEDGGEEAEVAALYLIGPNGQPWRVGMAAGNEFSDHQFEKKNYLNLAGSKLRTCSLGPELVVDADFQSVPGRVTIERRNSVVWTGEIATGERNMCHSLRNLEHHHFKFALHRRPGDVHIHFLGAHSLSFGHGVHLEDGDVMEVKFEGFGRALRNPVQIEERAESLVETRSLA
ncbi:MAG TPA: AraD1 family protein [Acidobacteriaceae bacterium]|jgi:hypothetical protein|nr:AraD1 family protein [Acidobacteriaceae bacterium]